MPPSSQKPSTHLAASFKHFNTLFLQGTLGQGTPCLSVKSLLEGLLSLCCHPHCSSKLKTDRTNTENMLQQPPVWEGRQWGRGRQPGCPITSAGYGCEMKQVHSPPGYRLPQCNLWWGAWNDPSGACLPPSAVLGSEALNQTAPKSPSGCLGSAPSLPSAQRSEGAAGRSTGNAALLEEQPCPPRGALAPLLVPRGAWD